MIVTPEPMNPVIFEHVLNHLPCLLIRDFLIDLFTSSEKNTADLIEEGLAKPQADCYLYLGKFLNIDNTLHVITTFDGIQTSTGKETVSVKSLDVPANLHLAFRNSPVTLPPNAVANYKDDAPLKTTMGRVLLNYTILVHPFGDYIPYINSRWKIGAIEAEYIFDGLRLNKITVEQVKRYSMNLHFIGHFTELSVPTFTEKTLVIDPAVIARRDELLKQYAKEIAAGDEVVMNRIETELVNMDKKSIEGDSSTLFYDYTGGKSYNIHRKTMYIMGGMRPDFGSDGYAFIDNSLEDGWQIKNIPALYNSIRDATYSRAKETAKGGEVTNFLIRVFQNTRITEEDCKASRYLPVTLTKDIAEKFIYRNIIIDDAVVSLTEDNLHEYVGKTVMMRSPQYCQTGDGYCYVCMGQLFKTINTELLTMTAINVGRTFTIESLKKAHGKSSTSIKITSLNQFAI